MLIRNWNLLIAVVGVIFCLSHVDCEEQKSDTPKKRAPVRPPPPKNMIHHKFRSVRVNQVWEKAQRMGKEGKELESLKADLVKYDEKAYQLKKIERDGGDNTGEQSERINKQLTEIMKKHGIIPREKPKHVPTKDQPFMDKRLNELWKKTVDAEHFDEKEVKMMKQQLKVHQDKINQYQSLVDDLYGEGGNPNTVLAQRNAAKKEDFQAKELELKMQHKKLNKDFQLLSVKTMPEEERGGFKEPRIINFWREAQRTNFTEEEMISLKEELLHFEAKLMKYDNIQEEAMKAEQVYKRKKISGEKVDAKKHNLLKDKVKDVGSQIKKYFNEVKDKISSRKLQHSEL